MKPNHSQVKPKLISFPTELFLCKKWIFLCLGNKLIKRKNESLKFLFVFWRKSLFENLKTLTMAFFCWCELDFSQITTAITSAFATCRHDLKGLLKIKSWLKRSCNKGVIYNVVNDQSVFPGAAKVKSTSQIL